MFKLLPAANAWLLLITYECVASPPTKTDAVITGTTVRSHDAIFSLRAQAQTCRNERGVAAATKADYAGGTKYVERLYLSNLDLKTACI